MSFKMKCYLGGLSAPIERIEYSITLIRIEFHQSIWNFFRKRTWMLNESWRHWSNVPDRVCNLFSPFLVSCWKSFSTSASTAVHISFSQYKDEFMHYICPIIFWIWIDNE